MTEDQFVPLPATPPTIEGWNLPRPEAIHSGARVLLGGRVGLFWRYLGGQPVLFGIDVPVPMEIADDCNRTRQAAD